MPEASPLTGSTIHVGLLKARELDDAMQLARSLRLPLLVFMLIEFQALFTLATPHEAWLWLLASLALTGGSFVTTWCYESCKTAGTRQLQLFWWTRVAEMNALCCGIAVGAGAWPGLAHASEEVRHLWVFLVLVHCCASACLLPFRLIVAQIVGCLSPPVTWCAMQPSRSMDFEIATMLTSGVFLLALGYALSRGNHSRAKLGLRNEALAHQLEGQNSQLKGLAQTRSALLAGASHDLRQPVHALGLIMDLMDPRKPEALDRQLRAARNCVDALSEMMTQLLDFARMDLALYRVVKQTVAVHDLVGEVGRSLEPAARAKGLSLQVVVHDLWVQSDAKLLRRSLFNLVANAIEFSKSGEIRIVCELDGDEGVLHVDDAGPGMESGRRDQIWGEYLTTKAVAESAQRTRIGLGLGLSVVSKACQLLGHEVQVSSRGSRGSRFTLRLGVQRPTPWRAASWVPDFSILHGVLVAIIEDDATVRMSLQLTLTRWGCEVVSAGDLKTLERKLEADGRLPQLIMSDLHLKAAQDGMAAVQQLRQTAARADTPAIIITGDLSPEVEQQTRANNITLAYKPFSPKRLQQLLVGALSPVAV